MNRYTLIAFSFGLTCTIAATELPEIHSLFSGKKSTADLQSIRALESIQVATSAAALTSFFLAGMVPTDYANVVLATCFFNQLAHIATNVALLKYKQHKSAVLRVLFPITALFSFIKMSTVLLERKFDDQDSIQLNLLQIGQDVADGEQLELILALIFSMGVLGQLGTLCSDCASADS